MGNFDTKHSPYYAIKDETVISDDKKSLKSTENNTFWTIKRANFDTDSKNASLFEYNNRNRPTTKHLGFAINQIKTLKTLRHPNIVKYFYSEEPPPSQQQTLNHHVQASLKCLLITEFIRPISSLIDNLNNEQVMHGIYGITNAIHFLHDKCQLSHNNLSENCIYVNCRQVWKLNDFELALPFEKLCRQALKNIFESKQKNAITPEEEANFKDKLDMDLDKVYQQAPHAIDAYGWALTILNLLPNSNQIKSFKSFFGDESSNTNRANDQQQLELYLSTEPTERPTLGCALKIQLFDLYRKNPDSGLENSDLSQLLAIDNLEDLEKNIDKLIEYLSKLSSDMVNEKLVEFLLEPFMFYSERIRKEVLPLIFIPKEVYVGEENFRNRIDFSNFYYSVYTDYVGGKCMQNEMTLGVSIEPFMEMSKYKTFVIPRVLGLMSMHTMQIRLVLLEYFPFYVGLINDEESLKYEVLPEMLLGLKDRNDEIVSKTFACLSVIVKILGSEIVVGKGPNHSDRLSIFSDKLPKTISIEFSKEKMSRAVETGSLKRPEQHKKTFNFYKNKSADFKSLVNSESNRFSDNLGFNMKDQAKFSSTTSLDQEMIHMNGSSKSVTPKLISDSMIALPGETEETKSNEIESTTVSNIKPVGNSSNKNNNKLDEDDWSNDWNGWDQGENTNENSNFEEANASMISLAGSVDMLVPPEFEVPKIKINHSLRNLTPNKQANSFLINTNSIGSEFDIKSIVIKKIEKPDLIDELFSDMQPIIVKEKKADVTRPGSGGKGNKKFSFDAKQLNGGSANWECEEILDLDEL